MARAEKATYKAKQPEFYSDFCINLDLNPVTGQLAKLTNEEEIKQSVKMAVLTGIGERPYNVTYGSKVKASMFDLADDLVIEDIKTSVRESFQHEPRAQFIGMDAVFQNLSLYIVIAFSCAAFPNKVLQVPIILKNVR